MELTAFSLISYMLLAGFIILVGYAGIKMIKHLIAINKPTSEEFEDLEDFEEGSEEQVE